MTKKVNSRIAYSFAGNIVKSITNFFTIFFIARIISPEEFGRMSYLISLFVLVRQILDSGITSAFFTFASQNKMNRYFYLIYFIWLIIQLIIAIVILLLVFPIPVITSILNNENIVLVTLVFLAGYAQGIIWQSAQYLAESHRGTGLSQLVGVVIMLSHLAFIVLANKFDYVTLELIFSALLVEYILGSIYIVIKYRSFFTPDNQDEIELRSSAKITIYKKEIRQIILLFYTYCLPLVPYTLLVVFQDFGDRWLLKEFAQIEHQGYYNIAMQFSAVSLLATSSVIQIFWKEFAEAYNVNDHERYKALYNHTVKILFFLSTFLSMFLIPYGKEILFCLLGESYNDGAVTFTIMLFYPIYQVLGQIDGTVLYATESTRLRLIISSFFVPISLFTAFMLLVPKSIFVYSLGLGSVGLAIKMIVIQFLYTNVTNYILWRKMGIQLKKSYQFGLIIFFLGLSTLIKYILDSTCIFEKLNFIHYVIIAFILYMLLTFTVVRRFSKIIGFSDFDLYNWLK